MNATLARVIEFPTRIYVQWEPPQEPNGIILAYTVYCKEVTATDGATPSESGSSSYLSSSGSGSATLTNAMFQSGEERSGSSGATPEYAILVVVNGTQSATHVDDLTPFTSYECFIAANTSVGEGESSVFITATTDESSTSYSHCCTYQCSNT